METPETMTLTIEARGEIISSNFPAFAEMVRSRLSEINRELSTDEDFDQADADAKAIAAAEASLKAAKEKALADAEQLHSLFSQIDGLSGDLSAARLDLSKQIAKRKEEVKSEVIQEALRSFGIELALARKHYLPGLQAAIKGRRTVDTMRTALRVYATTQQAMIRKCREILSRFEEAHGPELIMDRRELELQKPEGLEAELRRRCEAKRAADERKRLEAVAAKAKAEAAAALQQAAEAAKPPRPPARGGDWQKPPTLGETPTGPEAAKPPLPPTAATAAEAADFPFKDPIVKEWEEFKTAVFTSFRPLKSARAALRHPDNVARAARFAQAINAAWQAAHEKEVA